MADRPINSAPESADFLIRELILYAILDIAPGVQGPPSPSPYAGCSQPSDAGAGPMWTIR